MNILCLNSSIHKCGYYDNNMHMSKNLILKYECQKT